MSHMKGTVCGRVSELKEVVDTISSLIQMEFVSAYDSLVIKRTLSMWLIGSLG